MSLLSEKSKSINPIYYNKIEEYKIKIETIHSFDSIISLIPNVYEQKQESKTQNNQVSLHPQSSNSQISDPNINSGPKHNQIELEFEAIKNFVQDLADIYGNDVDDKPLEFYAYLLKKTNMTHMFAVKKHLEIFRKFCVDNEKAILNNEIDNLTTDKIVYSSSVYIDLKNIISKADTTNKKIILEHLLYLISVLNKNLKADDLLKMISKCTDNIKKGEGFIMNLVETIQDKIKIPDNSEQVNIGDVFKQIVTSGVIGDIFSMVQEKISGDDFNINNLLNGLTK